MLQDNVPFSLNCSVNCARVFKCFFLLNHFSVQLSNCDSITDPAAAGRKENLMIIPTVYRVYSVPSSVRKFICNLDGTGQTHNLFIIIVHPF